MIEQWGIASGASGSQNIYANFNIYFTKSNYNINALIQRDAASGENVTYASDFSNTQIRFRTSANQRTIQWSVKGY